MASWCHFSWESSEQMAKIWDLNLFHTTPLRTTKKLVWIGFKRISEQRGFSKSLPFLNSNIALYTQDLRTLSLGADSGKQMHLPLLRPSGEIKMRKLSGNACLDMSSNSFPSIKMLSCYCYVHKAAWDVWTDSLLFNKEVGKSDTLQDIPGQWWISIQKASAKVIWGLVMEKICLLVITGKHWGQVNLILCMI